MTGKIKNWFKYNILEKIYFRLKKKFDPRISPELIIRLNYKTGYIDAETACLPCSFEGEKENNPNTWAWLDEFSVPIKDLKNKNRTLWTMWVEDFFVWRYEQFEKENKTQAENRIRTTKFLKHGKNYEFCNGKWNIRSELRTSPTWDGTECKNGHPLHPEEAYLIGICPICEPEKFKRYIEEHNKK